MNESVSIAVVYAVSDVLETEPESMQQLTEVIDPDALDSLFSQRLNGQSRESESGQVKFVYSGCEVTVENGEFITVDEIEPEAPSEEEEKPASATT